MREKTGRGRPVSVGLAALLAAGSAVALGPAAHAAPEPTQTVGLSGNPVGLALTADGATAYVPVTDDFVTFSLDIVDTAARRVTSVSVPGLHTAGPAVLSRDEQTLYLGSQAEDVISAIDLATFVVTTVQGTEFPTGIALAPGGRTLYESGLQGVAMVDLDDGSRVRLPDSGPGLDRAVFSPSGDAAYLLATKEPSSRDAQIVVIDTATRTQRGTIAVDPTASALAISPDGRTLYTGSTRGTLTAVDVESGQTTMTRTFGSHSSIEVSSDGQRLYSGNYADDVVNIIDTRDLALVRRADAGGMPGTVRLSPDGLTAFTPNFTLVPGTAGTFAFIDVREAPALTAETPPTSTTAGQAYSYQFAATGRPSPVFSYAGDLPPGLTLSRAGLLSGTPTAPGDYEFTISADNGLAPAATTEAITITVLGVAPEFVDASPPVSATEGASYDYTFRATGTPTPRFSVDGTLPEGLTMSDAGRLSGTPTTPGTFDFRVVASNGVSPEAVTDSMTITVVAAATPTPTPAPTMAAPTPAPTRGAGSLAHTGTDASVSLWMGAGILAAGAFVLTCRRLRRSR